MVVRDASIRTRLLGILPLRWLVLRFRWCRWILGGRRGPPPSLVKQGTIRRMARTYGLRVLIETGTYMGDMMAAVQAHFERLYTIEVDAGIFEFARHRLRRWRHVTPLLGDSQDVLPEILSKERGPILFWLDAHYSGGITGAGVSETPIERELEVVAQHPAKGHVILIDDARCFDGTGGYPDMGTVHRTATRLFPDADVNVVYDMIQILPRRRVTD